MRSDSESAGRESEKGVSPASSESALGVSVAPEKWEA